jgi:hypothetical protein
MAKRESQRFLIIAVVLFFLGSAQAEGPGHRSLVVREDLFRLPPDVSEATLTPAPIWVPYLVEKVLLHPAHRAVILHVQTDAIYFVKEGDQLEGWTVHYIDSKGVLLTQGEKQVALKWHEADET